MIIAGASEEAYEARFADIRQDIASVRSDLKQDIERTNDRINTLTWMAGTNIVLTIAVLGRLLFVH
ncbi:MAG: hypothetical protein JO212_07735 [Acetobacteraceae bacterium]|nr:hypothetical protein [Acetobacteraceae bacterium]